MFVGRQQRTVATIKAVRCARAVVQLAAVALPARVTGARVRLRVTLAVARAVDVHARAAVVLAQLSIKYIAVTSQWESN